MNDYEIISPWKLITILVIILLLIIGIILYATYRSNQSCLEQGYEVTFGNLACYEIDEETNTAEKLTQINSIWRKMK